MNAQRRWGTRARTTLGANTSRPVGVRRRSLRGTRSRWAATVPHCTDLSRILRRTRRSPSGPHRETETDQRLPHERRKEALDHRVVESRAGAAQALNGAKGLERGEKRAGDVRRSKVRMVDEAGAWAPTADRARQCTLDQIRSWRRPEGVADEAAAVQVDHGGGVQPALAGPDLLDIDAPPSVGRISRERVADQVRRVSCRSGWGCGAASVRGTPLADLPGA